MSVPDHALANRYAARLTHEYARVVERTLLAVHNTITREVAWLLQSMQTAPLPPALIAQIQSQGNAPKQASAIAAENRIASLKQLAAEAVDSLNNSATHLAQLGNRYDEIMLELTQSVITDDGFAEQTDSILSTFMAGARERAQALMSRLAEARFDEPEFTRILTDELLDKRTLHQLLTEALESSYLRQAQRWRDIAGNLQLRLDAEPQLPAVDMGVVIQAYLEPIQLVYERPNVLRSIANVLTRGKLYDKLTQEINTALSNVSTRAITLLQQLLAATEQQWSDLTRQAADKWFSEQTGIQRDALEQRLTQWEEHKKTLQSWSEHLQEITPERVLWSWQSGLTKQALQHVVGCIVGEARR